MLLCACWPLLLSAGCAGLAMCCCVLVGPCCFVLAVVCAACVLVGPCCLALATLHAAVRLLAMLLGVGCAVYCCGLKYVKILK